MKCLRAEDTLREWKLCNLIKKIHKSSIECSNINGNGGGAFIWCQYKKLDSQGIMYT